jgi:hypothetical protein
MAKKEGCVTPTSFSRQRPVGGILFIADDASAFNTSMTAYCEEVGSSRSSEGQQQQKAQHIRLLIVLGR